MARQARRLAVVAGEHGRAPDGGAGPRVEPLQRLLDAALAQPHAQAVAREQRGQRARRLAAEARQHAGDEGRPGRAAARLGDGLEKRLRLGQRQAVRPALGLAEGPRGDPPGVAEAHERRRQRVGVVRRDLLQRVGDAAGADVDRPLVGEREDAARGPARGAPQVGVAEAREERPEAVGLVEAARPRGDVGEGLGEGGERRGAVREGRLARRALGLSHTPAARPPPRPTPSRAAGGLCAGAPW